MLGFKFKFIINTDTFCEDIIYKGKKVGEHKSWESIHEENLFENYRHLYPRLEKEMKIRIFILSIKSSLKTKIMRIKDIFTIKCKHNYFILETETVARDYPRNEKSYTKKVKCIKCGNVRSV